MVYGVITVNAVRVRVRAVAEADDTESPTAGQL